MLFQDLGKRKVVADFSGGQLSSDGGALLLGQLDAGLGISRMLAACYHDRRNPDLIEHSVQELVTQRLSAQALGYEDLNDHEHLRRDPLLATVVGKEDVTGQNRRSAKDRGAACASPSTLNRLDLGSCFEDRYRKIHADPQKVEAALLEAGVRCLPKDQKLFILDFDATDMPLHGKQENRFFHGYYDSYCYLPLYCFCGSVVLWAQLRPSGNDASAGTVEALQKIVSAIRERIPDAKIVVRGDSGFARDAIMTWCEEQREVYYLLGLPRNARLQAMIEPATVRARMRWCLCGVSTREYVDTRYRTLKSWSCERRLLAKAEVLCGEKGPKSNPRFVVTNVPFEGVCDGRSAQLIEGDIKSLYEKGYCGRGDAENMIKQMTLDLDADRVSSSWMAANQMRVWFAAFAYLLLDRLRNVGLKGSELAKVSLGTIRLRLLKVAAVIRVSTRRVHIALNTAFPLQDLFRTVHRRLSCVMEFT